MKAKVNYDQVREKPVFKNMATGWCSIHDFVFPGPGKDPDD
jgi:hypothetical protein